MKKEGKEAATDHSFIGVICVSLKHLNVPGILVTFPKSRESRVSRLNTVGWVVTSLLLREQLALKLVT